QRRAARVGSRRRRPAMNADDELTPEQASRQAVTAVTADLEYWASSAAVVEAVRLLDRGASVASTAERAFVSERALQRRFAQDIGYGPKTLQRVLRFQRFLRALHGTDADLAGAAALAGYADQSHLSRETRRLADLSPLQLTQWRH
ncbi:MAG TPA: helix-turn-helix domain-containing protein, partial [Conexibacter sp.]